MPGLILSSGEDVVSAGSLVDGLTGVCGMVVIVPMSPQSEKKKNSNYGLKNKAHWSWGGIITAQVASKSVL